MEGMRLLAEIQQCLGTDGAPFLSPCSPCLMWYVGCALWGDRCPASCQLLLSNGSQRWVMGKADWAVEMNQEQTP